MANILLATTKEPPPRGSIQEFVLTNLMIRREHMEVAKTRTIVQSLLKPEAAVKVWQDYINEAFPWVEEGKKQQDQQIVDILKREVAMGPIRIEKVYDRDREVRSRIRTKILKRGEQDADRYESILRKLPKTVPR